MRLNFADFITENSKTAGKTVVFSFGRFQPPTIGHKLLVDKVVSLAKQHKADHIIFASRTQDKKSNPLDVETKVHFLKKMFPKANFEPANDEVRTFIEALKKLYKQGYKNVYMVAGSDRLADYQKLFDKYNGGEDFDFSVLEAVSAGERDPDAEGAAGMSGTKMRKAAVENDFHSFRTGIPSTLSDADTKALMTQIRRGLSLKEFVEHVSQPLMEGVNDHGIFKVVFLAGGPGSGKDYVMKQTLGGLGLTEINSDKAFEYLMDKFDFDKKMGPDEEAQRELVRKKAKNTTEAKQRLALQGRNGLIINGTGDDPEKIKKMYGMLKKLGYDEPMMLMVNTRDSVSKQRNKERGDRGGRTVPENIRKEKWDAVQSSIEKYKEMFGQNYNEYDNSETLTGENVSQDLKDYKTNEMANLFKRFKKYTEAPVENDIAKDWIDTERKKASRSGDKTQPAPDTRSSSSTEAPADSYTTPDPVGQEGKKLVPQDVMAKAESMGLVYLRFGRFGPKDGPNAGKVTHKEKNGELVPVNESFINEEFKSHKSPIEIARKHKVPLIKIMKQLKMGIKVEHEHTKSSKTARIIALQHLDEIPNYYTRLKKAEKGAIKEGYEFSSPDAYQLLTLTRTIDEQPKKKSKSELVGLFSKMLELLSKEDLNETNIEENTSEDSSVGKGKDFATFIVEETSRTSDSCSSNSRYSSRRDSEKDNYQKSNKTKTKIEKLKERFIESYDSPSAEAPGVFGYSKDQITKKGKASVTELTGDENAVSIPAQKEDELKKVTGREILSFKSKNPIG